MSGRIKVMREIMSLRQMAKSEQGAALVIVLLFMVIVFSLVTAMLVRTGGEIVIAGRYRDATQALELAQGGLEEAVRRIEVGNPSTEFTASFSDAVRVRAIPRAVGVGGAIVEVQADATVGLARRRLSLLILQIVEEAFPNITYGRHMQSSGSATVESGDVYSQTFVRYKTLPSSGTITYAGWRISKDSPGAIGYCYENNNHTTDCSGQVNWYPGHRRSAYNDESLPPGYGFSTIGLALDFTCPRPVPETDSRFGKTVNDAGWQTNDTRHDKTPPNGMDSGEPLYGCTTDNLPYTWIRDVFTSSDGTPPANPPKTENMWFKVVSFDQWHAKYYTFDEDERKWEPNAGSNPVDNPELGVVPPPPPFEKLKKSFSASETFTSVSSVDSFGNCVNPNPDPPYECREGSVPKKVLLDNGNPATTWTINANIDGHGVLLVNGNLRINGNLTYHGTIVVNGQLTIASGDATIYGGIVGNAKVEPSGNLKIFGGGDVATTPPLGRSTVERRAWFER